MPGFVAALLGGLLTIVGSMVGRALVALGIGAVAYTGVSTSLDWLKTQAVQNFTGLGTQAVALAAYMKVGECISLVFSAILVRLLLNGLTSDTIKRIVAK